MSTSESAGIPAVGKPRIYRVNVFGKLMHCDGLVLPETFLNWALGGSERAFSSRAWKDL
jgi:hypothetical protein